MSSDGYIDLPHLLAMARRVKAAGLKLLVCFHYSDFWADPGKQGIPRAWQGQDLASLAQTVHDYTMGVVSALAEQGTPPDMVQIGNEITNGMLWPTGKIYDNGQERWDPFLQLLKAGIAGASDGAGIMYWEPAWLPGVAVEPEVGNPWDNLTLFGPDGHVLPSIRWSTGVF